MKPERVFGAAIALVMAAALGGCAGDAGGDVVLPAPAEGIVNAQAGGVPLVAPTVPPEAVYAFKPFADRFAAAYAANTGSYDRAVAATAAEGFTILDEAALTAAFQGQMRRQFYLDTGGGATNRYTADLVATPAGTPAWRLESTGGTRYSRYSFRTVDGIAQICLDGISSRCGAGFTDARGTLGVMWVRPEGITGWVYGPPAAAPTAAEAATAATP